jgi:hypothetical protein
MRLLQRPVAALQPFAQAVETKVLFTHARELAPWQVGPPPSHCTQPWPLARQIWPLHAPVQQTCPLDWVLSQASVWQSPAVAQVCPTGPRHAPRRKTSAGSGQTQAPSAPHTRPVAPQFGVQQRSAPATSESQVFVAHCASAEQACPFASRPVQTPVAGSQPLPHTLLIRAPFSQRCEVPPAHVEAAPSHCTQAEPSTEQNAPAQAVAQHRVGPATVATQLPETQSAPA